MKIAVIGGGFTGLTAAYKLAKAGHRVTVFEKDKVLGGLAHGFKRPGWDWHLEYAYHHLFANDWAILSLIKELGLEDKLLLTRPVTANLIDEMSCAGDRSEGLAKGAGSPPGSQQNLVRLHSLGFVNQKTLRPISLKTDLNFRWRPQADDLSAGNERIVQLDSPIHLLTYPELSPLDKLRTAALLAFCKINPFWQPLEGVTAKNFFETIGGKRAWQALWEPLMAGKFGDLADTVAASWLAARIKKRTPKLYYIEGGFHTLIVALERAIIAHAGRIYTNTAVTSIRRVSGNSYYVLWGKHKERFGQTLLTVPTPIANKLLPQPLIPNTSTQSPLSIPHLHAQTLILETKEPILKDTYWLNITDRTFPFLAVVAHTNMVDKKYYSNHHITYFGNYLPSGHPYLSMTKKQLLKIFFPYIQRLNPSYHLSLITYHLFTGFYAQPVHQLHYSQRAPRLETAIKGVSLANLDSIYPWDRGTNYAVELGVRAARAIIQSDQ